MMSKKFLILFVLASLAGHALVLALTTRIDWAVSPPPERAQEVITVELKAPPEKVARRPLRRNKEQQPAAGSGSFREGTATLQGDASPYRDYLLQVRRKIEQRWSYPPQAIAAQEEGNAVIRFTIDANGSLSGYDVMTTSGSEILDRGALAVVKAAAPYAPLPIEFNLSRLHITATFSYRMGE
jgi:periplasmic protein TonB